MLLLGAQSAVTLSSATHNIFTEHVYINTLRMQQMSKVINPVIACNCFEGKEMTRQDAVGEDRV